MPRTTGIKVQEIVIWVKARCGLWRRLILVAKLRKSGFEERRSFGLRIN